MTAPEIWFKGQRVLRTIVQAFLLLVPIVNGVAAAVIGYLREQEHVTVDPIVFMWLNVIVAVTALLMGLVARIMAVPGVNDLLTRIGLGSVTKRSITLEQDTDGTWRDSAPIERVAWSDAERAEQYARDADVDAAERDAP